MRQPDDSITGILLAAGKGERFDPSGAKNKLTQLLPDGDMVVVAAARNMLSVLPTVVAVVRPHANEVADALLRAGCTVLECPDAAGGMGMSLAYAISRTDASAGWLVGLGDMPFVQRQTIAALAQALRDGAPIAAPVHQGRRGNPVGFGRMYLQHLLRVTGDRGARELLKQYPVCAIEVKDFGIHCDIDTPADLEPN